MHIRERGMHRTESPRKDVGEVCSSLSHRVYIWGPGLFTEPKRLRKWPLKGKGLSSSFTGDTTPFPSLFGPAQALARAEASCGGTHTSSCRPWERQGQRMRRGSDEEQLLSSHQADGRPKDRHPIHFILGTIRVHFVCSHIAPYSHESEQAKGKPQGLPVLSASLFFPAVGVHATIASWSGVSPSIHTPTPWHPWHNTWSSCAGIFTSLVWKKQYLLSWWRLDKKCRSAMGKCSSKHSWEASLVDWTTEALALQKELRSVQIKWAKSNLWWLSGFLKNGCRSAQFNKTAHSAWKYFFSRDDQIKPSLKLVIAVNQAADYQWPRFPPEVFPQGAKEKAAVWLLWLDLSRDFHQQHKIAQLGVMSWDSCNSEVSERLWITRMD